MIFKTFCASNLAHDDLRFVDDILESQISIFMKKNPGLVEVERSTPSVSIATNTNGREPFVYLSVTSKFEFQDMTELL